MPESGWNLDKQRPGNGDEEGETHDFRWADENIFLEGVGMREANNGMLIAPSWRKFFRKYGLMR